ncbi:hypothetical protein [Nostoc sp.]|uniref:hypothetical protein n=1 Tax=Nostoc sp. TaxID=1180 RepID=UPI002FF9046B
MARNAINRLQDEGLIIVEAAIYRVFAISEFLSKNLNRTVLQYISSQVRSRKACRQTSHSCILYQFCMKMRQNMRWVHLVKALWV